MYDELKSPFRDFIQNEYVDVWLLAARFCGNARNAKDEFRSVKAGVGIRRTGAITPGGSLTIRAY